MICKSFFQILFLLGIYLIYVKSLNNFPFHWKDITFSTQKIGPKAELLNLQKNYTCKLLFVSFDFISFGCLLFNILSSFNNRQFIF